MKIFALILALILPSTAWCGDESLSGTVSNAWESMIDSAKFGVMIVEKGDDIFRLATAMFWTPWIWLLGKILIHKANKDTGPTYRLSNSELLVGWLAVALAPMTLMLTVVSMSDGHLSSSIEWVGYELAADYGISEENGIWAVYATIALNLLLFVYAQIKCIKISAGANGR